MVAHNVAWAIARSFENDVVVADLDLAFGTAGLDFNQDPTQGIAEAVNAPDRLDDMFLDRLLATLLRPPEPARGAGDARPHLRFRARAPSSRSSTSPRPACPAVVLDLPHVWTAG